MIQLKRALVATVIFLTVLILMLGCSAQQQYHSNTELVVSYDDGSIWKSKEHVRAAALIPEPKFLIFGAEWCASCIHLQRLLKSAKILNDTSIIFLNASEDWVRNLMAQIGGISGVPYMIEVKADGTFGKRKFGTNTILVHLLAHIEVNE